LFSPGSYTTYVQQKVLTPRGITRMKLGRTLTRATGEVPYYSQKIGRMVLDASGKTVAAPYGTDGKPLQQVLLTFMPS
jgi:hypothetical protein